PAMLDGQPDLRRAGASRGGQVPYAGLAALLLGGAAGAGATRAAARRAYRRGAGRGSGDEREPDRAAARRARGRRSAPRRPLNPRASNGFGERSDELRTDSLRSRRSDPDRDAQPPGQAQRIHGDDGRRTRRRLSPRRRGRRGPRRNRNRRGARLLRRRRPLGRREHLRHLGGERGDRRHSFIMRIFNCRKPSIAAINGAAVGVGITLALPMDIRIASSNARFGFVFSRRGLVPEAGSAWFLPRIVGISQALRWCYSGRIFDADEALKGGLVSELAAPEALMGAARSL